jgi:hypothetical protein
VAAGGLVQIVPTSITTTGGSGSISSTGNVSFTSASAISLNSCFSSTYDNYKILINTTGMSTNLECRFRLRSSGTDASGSNYSGGGFYNYSSGATVGGLNYNGATFYTFGGAGTILNSAAPARNLFVIDISKPFIASETMWNSFISNQDTGGFRATIQGNLHDAGISYDGFSIFTSTGTFTGTITVYGYRK